MIKLVVYYEVLDTGENKKCTITGKRIKTTRDRLTVEKAIAKKLGYNRVKIFNWKVIGGTYEKYEK